MRAKTDCALVACISMTCVVSGCERRTGGDPWVIAGPTVPSVVLREPFVWDTPDELRVWTDNTVSRGTYRVDTEGSNGVIAIEFLAGRFDLLLRGPNLDPPLRRVRAVRIRYLWKPTDDRDTCSFAVRFNAVNSPRADLQLHGGATLRPSSAWIETELRVPSYAFTYTPLDVDYIYFEGDTSNDGVLRIDSIALLTEP